jgi:hypothetical protein
MTRHPLPPDITGKYVRLTPEALTPEYRTEPFRTVLVLGGFGCRESNIGSKVFVRFADGDEGAFRRHHVLRTASPFEVIAAGFSPEGDLQ